LLVFAGLLALPGTLFAAVSVAPAEGGAAVRIDGQLFAKYVVDFHGTPIVWPILGPNGTPMTRPYPMDPSDKSERQDHPHHRSLWFNHGDVNGLSFWDRETIKHREFIALESGEQGLIVTRNEWVAPDGKAILRDIRRLRFGADERGRWIDFTSTLTPAGGPVVFGDTKEGSFGVRVPDTMRVDAKQSGQIVNSDGLKNQDAWGERASWVDYHGPVNNEVLGIAIMNHPSSFRYPTFWHVRTYGLFAANPFGEKSFTGTGDGSYTLAPGRSITLRYRLLFHRGDEKAAKVAEAFAEYAAEPAAPR
jgi:hypothetical protein